MVTNLLLPRHWALLWEKVRNAASFRMSYVQLLFVEEIDSYLYQTVGQDAIELVASALGVPLYRRVITGSAIEQGSEYGARSRIVAVEGDETEDLYELLLKVKVRKHNFF